jgi:Arc-like DNA binding domain
MPESSDCFAALSRRTPCGLAFGETRVARKKADIPEAATQVASRTSKTAEAGKASDRVQFRLPEGMRDKLVEVATANGRTLNEEIIDRLTQSLERDGIQKLSDRLKAQGDRLATFEGELASIVERLRPRDE